MGRKSPPLTEAQQSLAAANVALAHWWAGRMARGMPLADGDDAAGVALEGLCHAARKFDPSRGHAFSTYASHWIRQRIQRWHRDRLWAKGRLSVTSLDTPREDGSSGGDWEPTAEPRAEQRAEIRELIATARSLCPPDWWRVLEARWLGEREEWEATERDMRGRNVRVNPELRTLAEAGAVLGMSRERVRQIEDKALAWLYERMPDPMLEVN